MSKCPGNSLSQSMRMFQHVLCLCFPWLQLRCGFQCSYQAFETTLCIQRPPEELPEGGLLEKERPQTPMWWCLRPTAAGICWGRGKNAPRQCWCGSCCLWGQRERGEEKGGRVWTQEVKVVAMRRSHFSFVPHFALSRLVLKWGKHPE